MIEDPEAGGCAGRAGAHLPVKATVLTIKPRALSHISDLQTAPQGAILPLTRLDLKP